MSATRGLVYLDSSALLKLVREESETPSLVDHLRGGAQVISSAMAQVEVVRAVRRVAPEQVPSARKILRELDSVPLDGGLLRAAGDLGESTLRTLDAIHVAAAASLGDELAEVITYDRRMADVARALGMSVAQPA